MISVFGSKVGEEELNEIQSSLKAQWMGIGPKTKKFEGLFAKRLNVGDFVLLNSGSNSLYMAIKLLNLPKGTEVILPSFTWIACAHSIVLADCVPVFCDVDLETQNVSSETIHPWITPRTGAIMVVHYAGKPVDIKPISEFGIPIIEDAAHAVDSKLDGKYCGTLGAIGIYSFDSVKNLAMGEAGGLTSNDTRIIKKAKKVRYCGIGKSGFEASANKDNWWEYDIIDFYPKLIPNDIMASIGLAQLKKLDGFQKYRKKIWDLYQKEFSSLEWLILPTNPSVNEQHSYFTYFIRVRDEKRGKFAKYLFDNGIYTTLRYHPLHMNAIYKSSARLRNCEQLNKDGLNLPLHPNLSSSDIDKIITTVRAFM